MSQITALIIFVAFLAYIAYQGMKNFQLRSLNMSIRKKDFDTVHKMADMATTRKFLGDYTCDLYQLRAYYLAEDMSNFETKLKEMTKKDYPNNQDKKTFLEQYYHRFLIRNDREHAKLLLEQIKYLGDDFFTAYNEQAFYVMLDKSTDFVQPIIDEINSKKYYGFPLGVMLFMLAKQYEYLGDTENAQTYYENSKVCFHPKAIYVPVIEEIVKNNANRGDIS